MSDSTESYHLPDFLRGLFCKPSLMKGENPEVYAKLYAQVEEVVQPKDVFDQMMVSDITNHFWEQQRIRRCSGGVIDAARRRAFYEIMRPICGYRHQYAEEIAEIYFSPVTSAEKPRSAAPPGEPEHKTKSAVPPVGPEHESKSAVPPGEPEPKPAVPRS